MKTKKSKRFSKISPDHKRSHTVSSRLNPKELSRLDEFRSQVKMKRGEFLREAALDKPPPIVPPINQDQWVELGRLSSNINQISKKLNEGDELEKHLSELRRLVVETRKNLLGGNVYES